MDIDEFIARLLREPQWTQFQLYALFPDCTMLQLVGRVSSITIDTRNRLACGCGEIYRAKGDGWERLGAQRTFHLPGSIPQLSASLSADGTIDILSTHPKESTYTIFFKDCDPGEGTGHTENEYRKLDLVAIAAIAVPEVVETARTDDDVPF